MIELYIPLIDSELVKNYNNSIILFHTFTGIRLERRLFHSTFSTNDQKIGMTAFLEKKKPVWSDS